MSLWLALTAPTALSPPEPLANWLEGAPRPPSSTQGWQVSEGRAEGPCGWARSQWGPGAWVENQSSKVTRKPRFDLIHQPSLRPPPFTRWGGLLSVVFGASVQSVRL